MMSAEATAARELVEGVLRRPGYTSSVGTRVVHAEPGRLHVAVDRRTDLLQFGGSFHGGVIAGLADFAAGGAVTTLLPADRMAVTVDLSLNFLSPANGQSIIAKAEALHVGGTLCFARVEIATVSGGEERACAFGAATLRAVPAGSSHMSGDRRS